MHSSNDLTRQLTALQLQIMKEPDKKYRLILKALKRTKCRHDQQEIKNF